MTNPYCDCRMSIDDVTHTVELIIQMKVVVDGHKVSFIAAAPIDRHASYSGSALPFASAEMAIDGSPSKGTVHLDVGNATRIRVLIPNSYYSGLGTVLIPPTVYIVFQMAGEEKVVAVKVEEPVAYRTLTYDRRRTTAVFYDDLAKLPVRSQEQVLRDSAYYPRPNAAKASFWGLRPAL